MELFDATRIFLFFKNFLRDFLEKLSKYLFMIICYFLLYLKLKHLFNSCDVFAHKGDIYVYMYMKAIYKSYGEPKAPCQLCVIICFLCLSTGSWDDNWIIWLYLCVCLNVCVRVWIQSCLNWMDSSKVTDTCQILNHW